jgi:hypothetical protein
MSENKQGDRRREERGAALITALLISFLLLAAGGALMLTVGFTVGNTAEPTSEMRAYYAAESGMQQVLNVLRGHVAPNISYRAAITPAMSNNTSDSALTYARLSKWLTYDATYTDRVSLVPAGTYAPLTGTAFNTVLSDPDNSHLISFTTSGSFTLSGVTYPGTLNFGSGSNLGSIAFTPQTVTALNAYPTAASLLGSLRVSGSPQNYLFPSSTTFTLTINQTLPWPATALIRFNVEGAVSSQLLHPSNPLRLTLVGNSPKYLAEGVEYSLASLTFPFPLSSSSTGFSTSLPVIVKAPDPRRILVDVTGFGPRASVKKMQMMVGRLTLDYDPQATIAIRGADTIDPATGVQTLMTFSDGNSNPHSYSGNPISGTPISAFAVTNTPDYNLISGLNSSGNVTGSPPVQQVPLSRLPIWLQDANAARTLLNTLESVARAQGRLFTTANPPPDLGTSANPKFTFVNGDADLGTSGGAGLMVVTGTFNTRGAANFDGLILVLGGGVLTRNGGGNGDTLGAVAIARFDRNTVGAPFLAPTFDTNGGGVSNVQYDPAKVLQALGLAGRSVLAMREY